jgi:hypothetical protein
VEHKTGLHKKKINNQKIYLKINKHHQARIIIENLRIYYRKEKRKSKKPNQRLIN